MTSLADRTIAALRTNHDDLAALVPTLSADQLTGASGASEWSVAQVLSHLGSGAEIALAGYQAAFAGTPAPEQDFNQRVWGRWNALTPREQAADFLAHDAELVAALEALTSDQRETLQVKLGFLPSPLPLAAVAGMRLNESTLHGWDVRVALDPGAALEEDTAVLLADHLAGDLSFLLGFSGKADVLSEPTVVEVQGSPFGLTIDDRVTATAAVRDATATFTGPLEAVLRLIAGRLAPDRTPDAVEVTGNVTLDDLRRVFPGY
ncbi:MAG: maleylpyruvate isomerase family mycothiol-dependent enzyme [Marmoricola sp.]